MEEVLFQGDHLLATGTDLSQDRIFVTFDHLRRARSGFPDYSPVKTALRRDMGHLFIGSARNDWFLNRDTRPLRKALNGFGRRKIIYAVGFSMGGYGALLFARNLHIRHALLVAPQFSIFPDNAPYETNYTKEAEASDAGQDRLKAPPKDPLKGAILYDPRLQPVDRLHAQNIAHIFPDLSPVALPFGGHPPLHLMEGKGGYAKMLRALLDDQLTPQFVRNLHREYRADSDHYSNQISRYLDQRKLR